MRGSIFAKGLILNFFAMAFQNNNIILKCHGKKIKHYIALRLNLIHIYLPEFWYSNDLSK